MLGAILLLGGGTLAGCVTAVVQFGSPVSATAENARRASLHGRGDGSLTLCTAQGERVRLLAPEIGKEAACGTAVEPGGHRGVGPLRCIRYSDMESITEFRPRHVGYSERYANPRQAACPLFR